MIIRRSRRQWISSYSSCMPRKSPRMGMHSRAPLVPHDLPRGARPFLSLLHQVQASLLIADPLQRLMKSQSIHQPAQLASR